MIVDPTDPTKAIDPETGNMASEIYLVSKIANPEARRPPQNYRPGNF